MENLTSEILTQEQKLLEIKSKIITMDPELVEYTFFKIFMADPNHNYEMIKFFKDDVPKIQKMYNISQKVSSLINTSKESRELINQITSSNINYKKILEKCRDLALELSLKSSLEVANLFTYLLWNGYFSVDKNLVYQSKDRLNLPGLYSYDIMSGKGVCLNFSDMLSDYINEFENYSAATLINSVDDELKKNYKVEIVRKTKEKTLSEKIFVRLLNPFIKISGNHAYNLIKENKNMYIYDSTNLSAFNIINKNKSILINGTGTSDIKSYLSYFLNLSDKSIDTLDLLHKTSEFDLGCSIGDFIITWEECLHLLKKNKNILNDFYSEIQNNILEISKNNLSAKLIIKEYKKNNI